ncbi:unnamed protein product [Cylindrotheca closterium]|uniref:DUF6824 domain-containing protein n=1 Tax=Cylindrotheca closterium TaxID=2856 RepID=A0AAD2FC25_9STRA|nr:unnamed protein product [Cylindrotheca closterium]
MNGIDITNYDVLVAPPIPGESEEYQLDRGKNHAGNNRLEVFLNMHRSSYDSARSRADFGECDNIVEKIVATVCHQCVPKGRFLVSSSSNSGESVFWNQMDEQNAKLFLHSVLRPIRPPPMQEFFEEKKRRRRSSLLRRSASESMVLSVLDSKKKLSKMKLGGTQEEPDWMSTQAGGVTLRRMDVMLTDGGQALDPNSQSVGNNRLHVLIAMNASKYQNASIDEKEKILNEIVGTVKIWTGRFLVQGGNGYEKLSNEDAMNALRNIFALRAGQAIPKRSSLPNPSLVQLPIRASDPMAPPMMMNVTRQSSAPVLDLSRQSSASMINSGPDVNMPELETLRLAAVNNLKKKMARQKIASRLEDKSGRGSVNPQQQERQQIASPLGAARRPMMPSMAMKRQSSVFGISPDLMQELAAGIDDPDDYNNRDPLPPTQSNDFASKFM